MRASKKTGNRKPEAGNRAEIHISGAEGICHESEIPGMSKAFIARALTHSRGRPDRIVITVEKIIGRPSRSPLLSVKTLACASPEEAWEMIRRHISATGISRRAVASARRLLKSGKTIRGASLICADTGKRSEPDKKRGVRVSRMGIDKSSFTKLSRRLSSLNINNPTVREALILASKVASCKDIIAEICISDDPDYTTGYIASRGLGYLRIPNIKHPGDMRGGRVFFLKYDADIGHVIDYLEKQPVILKY